MLKKQVLKRCLWCLKEQQEGAKGLARDRSKTKGDIERLKTSAFGWLHTENQK
jgi:hypothetical protein